MTINHELVIKSIQQVNHLSNSYNIYRNQVTSFKNITFLQINLPKLKKYSKPPIYCHNYEIQTL